MISLRQHAISLAAVFVALAVGVVLGSGFLSNSLVSGLRDETRNLHNEINALNDQKSSAERKACFRQRFRRTDGRPDGA